MFCTGPMEWLKKTQQTLIVQHPFHYYYFLPPMGNIPFSFFNISHEIWHFWSIISVKLNLSLNHFTDRYCKSREELDPEYII